MAVGQACEARWVEASKLAKEARLASLPRAAEIRSLLAGMKFIPAEQRKSWLQGENYEDHRLDLEALLHERAGSPCTEGNYDTEAPRLAWVSTVPFRGSRSRIISEVAVQRGLPTSAVDNLWQAYRRLARALTVSNGT